MHNHLIILVFLTIEAFAGMAFFMLQGKATRAQSATSQVAVTFGHLQGRGLCPSGSNNYQP
jgi:hypothetical protein